MGQTQQGWQGKLALIWLGQIISLFGSRVANFALIWWLTERTGSATVLALATLVSILPTVLVGPFAGALVDRWDRRTVMLVADGVSALAAAVLGLLAWQGLLDVWQIYLVMVVRAVAGAFQFPALQASISLMVPEAQLARVAGVNQTIEGVGAIVAPLLAALLLTLIPLEIFMAIDVATALSAMLLLTLVVIPRPPRAVAVDTRGAPSLLAEVRFGLSYIWAWPGLRLIMVMSALINMLLTPAFTLMPLLVSRHFGGGPGELGIISAAEGIGLVVGGLLLSIWGGFPHKITTVMLALLGMGIGVLLIGVAPASMFLMAVGGMLLTTLMAPLCNGPLMAIMQTVVEPGIQGRVFTVLGALSTIAAPLGLLLAGPLSDRFGIQLWYVIGAVVCMAMAIVGWLSPTIQQLEDRKAARVPVVATTQ